MLVLVLTGVGVCKMLMAFLSMTTVYSVHTGSVELVHSFEGKDNIATTRQGSWDSDQLAAFSSGHRFVLLVG